MADLQNWHAQALGHQNYAPQRGMVSSALPRAFWYSLVALRRRASLAATLSLWVSRKSKRSRSQVQTIKERAGNQSLAAGECRCAESEAAPRGAPDFGSDGSTLNYLYAVAPNRS